MLARTVEIADPGHASRLGMNRNKGSVQVFEITVPATTGRLSWRAGAFTTARSGCVFVDWNQERPGEEGSAMSVRVNDVMTKQVAAVRTTASFKEIAVRLREQRVSAFPVIDDGGKVIGVVSEADLIAKAAVESAYESQPGPLSGLLHRHELEKARGLTAAELMTHAGGHRQPVPAGEPRRASDVRAPGEAASRRDPGGHPGVGQRRE
jgi:CBS domain-containing protein